MAALNKENAIKKLEDLIGKIEGMRQKDSDSPEFKKWQRNTRVALSNIFGRESEQIEEFNEINFYVLSISMMEETPSWEINEAFNRGLEEAKAILESMIQDIREYWEEEPSTSIVSSKSPESLAIGSSNRVFIVHGHDTGLKEEVARFLTSIGLSPVILHEQPNKGRTIIEKFEEYADVPYAVVLLTPDDVGAPAEEKNNLRERARQNVLFEFGFFIGKLGRERVSGLVKGDIELPSDYSGVLYIPVDEGGAWKFAAIKELKTAGFDIDANRAL